MESQPHNPEFKNNPENFHPCTMDCLPVCGGGQAWYNYLKLPTSVLT